MAEFIYSMVRARKAIGEKLILDDVTMSFFPGAKIGVVGPNGAGKSTILKIMAGLDTPSNLLHVLEDGLRLVEAWLLHEDTHAVPRREPSLAVTGGVETRLSLIHI